MPHKAESVVQLADYGGPYSGNFIASLRQLDALLHTRGMRSVLVFSSIAEGRAWLTALRGEMPVHVLQAGLNVAGIAAAIARIAYNENAVLLHTHFTTFDVPAQLAALILLAKGRKVRVCWHYHSAFAIPKTAFRRVKDFVKHRVMGRRTPIIAVSEGVGRLALLRGAAPDNIKTIKNGIDCDRARCRTESRVEMRRQLGIPTDAIFLLAFAWEPFTKGADVLIEATKQLHSTRNNFVLCLVGEQRMCDFVRNAFASTATPDWIRCVAPLEEVGNLFNAADLFVSASRSEGFPYSVGEAFANGLPVVLTDIPGHRWAIVAPAAFAVPPENASKLAESIETLIEPGVLSNLRHADANREFVERNLSLATWAEQICKTYKLYLSS